MIKEDIKKLFELDDELEKLCPLVEYLRNKPDQDEPIRWAMNKIYRYIYLLRKHLSDYLNILERVNGID